MLLRLLGPVQLWAGDELVDLGPARQRTVLAALAVDAGRPVPVETVIDRVWGIDPPAGARSGLYSYLTRLRRAVASTGAGELLRVVTSTAGYVLEVDPDEVDLIRFRQLVAAAGGATVDDARRVELLDEALNLWRGPALASLHGVWSTATRELLGQQRVDVVLRWARAQFRLGRAATTVEPLRALAKQYPMVEPLAARLMEALARTGRSAEALECYGAFRCKVNREFGAEPGGELRDLHRTILRGGLDAQPEPAGPGPAQLPTAPAAFTGRERELATLDELIAGAGAADSQPAAPVPVAAVWGTPGVGKTALAVHWAHRAAHRFPDGQLYVDLRGFDPTGAPVTPAEAVRGFLDALGVPAQHTSGSLHAESARYRTALAGKRVLVVLDNAASAEQVRPLLPGTPGCAVVVTSRSQLSGLVTVEGAYPMTLDPLPAADAERLLLRRLGRVRTLAEPEAVAGIVAACDGLPLALAIVAGKASTDPAGSLASLADRLRDPAGRLDALDGGDVRTRVRAMVDCSYYRLSPPAARLLRLLGQRREPDVTVPGAAFLAGVPIGAARLLLRELGRAHLLVESAGRYRLPDLIRVYAAEKARLQGLEPGLNGQQSGSRWRTRQDSVGIELNGTTGVLASRMWQRLDAERR
jgi:DNA-binding SARP family transcriptional activator